MGWPLALGQVSRSPALYGGGGAPSSVIQSIQKGTITISGALSNTATISAVNTANSVLIYDGYSTTNNLANRFDRNGTRIELTNGTTVTAIRGVNSTNVTVSFTVIEFSSGVNSIQSGTIAIAGAGTSNTATISAVGANAFVLYLGAVTAINPTTYSDAQGAVELTNATTVTATCASGATLTIGYMVVDLDSTIVAGVRKISKPDTSASTAITQTITAVTVANSLLFYNGEVTAFAGTLTSNAFTAELTNGTTVTFTRVGAGTTSKTLYWTVVEFAATALNSAVQRGTITLTAAPSATATISSVNTSKAFVNWGNYRSTGVTPDLSQPWLDLTNATTVTMTINTAGSPVGAYEVLEFK